MIETGASPSEMDLGEGIDLNTTVSVVFQTDGQTVEQRFNEFLVDADKLAESYNLVFVNEYMDHRLTLLCVDAETGDALSGATFDVYRYDAQSGAFVRLEGVQYHTQDDGSVTVYEGDTYTDDTLYYIAQSDAPENYILPASPEKTYFYFSERADAVPEGLPAGATAVNLKKDYDTVTVTNTGTKLKVPVTVVWDYNEKGSWPEGVEKIEVRLYGASKTKPVATDTMTAGRPFVIFENMDAQDGEGGTIEYTVEETIIGTAGGDITADYATSCTARGPARWFVFKNQAAVSVAVRKSWIKLGGASEDWREDVGEVPFDLYRTTRDWEGTEPITRQALLDFLRGNDAERVGTVTLVKNQQVMQLDSLPREDDSGATYYYFVLEDADAVLNNEDSYAVTPAQGGTIRALTVTNQETVPTLTILISDNDDNTVTKTYDGQPFDFTKSIHIRGLTNGERETLEINQDATDADLYHAAFTRKDNVLISFTFRLTNSDMSIGAGKHTIRVTRRAPPRARLPVGLSPPLPLR